MAHKKVHHPLKISVPEASKENVLLNKCRANTDCGAWGQSVIELTVFAYDSSGETKCTYEMTVGAIGCTACQFGRNVHPLEHEEIGSTAKSTPVSLGYYDFIDDAMNDAFEAVRHDALQDTADIVQTAINRKNSK